MDRRWAVPRDLGSSRLPSTLQRPVSGRPLLRASHAPPGERAVQGIAGALAFRDRDKLLIAFLEAAHDGVGDLAVHLDMAFAGKGEGVRGGSRAGAREMGIMEVMSVGGPDRAGVAEQAAKGVGEEIREQGGFLELVGAAGSDEAGPVLEFGLPVPHAIRKIEAPHLLTQDFRVEERFGFEGHLPVEILCGTGKKPGAFVLRR